MSLPFPTIDPTKQALTLFDEFKRFAFKGNVIDLAVGVIIGGAFGKSHQGSRVSRFYNSGCDDSIRHVPGRDHKFLDPGVRAVYLHRQVSGLGDQGKKRRNRSRRSDCSCGDSITDGNSRPAERKVLTR